MARHTEQDSTFTAFYGTTLRTTLRNLITLFPESYTHNGNFGEEKVNFNFTLETEDDKVFTIYDWKEYRPLTLDEEINWHIGGFNGYDTMVACDEVLAMLEGLSEEERSPRIVKTV